MFGEVKKSAMGKWSIVLSIITLLYFYYILRSAIIFHSPNEYEYLGKVVCTYSGEQDKLYVKIILLYIGFHTHIIGVKMMKSQFS